MIILAKLIDTWFTTKNPDVMPVSEASKYPMTPPTKKYLEKKGGLFSPAEESTQIIAVTSLFHKSLFLLKGVVLQCSHPSQGPMLPGTPFREALSSLHLSQGQDSLHQSTWVPPFSGVNIGYIPERGNIGLWNHTGNKKSVCLVF